MDNLAISVIVPTFNNASILVDVLQALQSQTLSATRFEVIVVDDGSTDNTLKVIESLHLPSSYQSLCQKNQGAAVARNRGAELSQGDILLFLDSDVVPDKHLLQAHWDVHQQRPNSLVVGRTRSMAPENQTLFYQVMGRELYAFDLGEEAKILPFQALVSRNLSMLRALFLALGGFDEQFPNSGFEDTDFALRAVNNGFQLWYSPTASGEHRHSALLEQVGRHMYNYQISAALLFRKHPEARGQFPHLRDKEPIVLGRDRVRVIVRKVIRWIFTLPIVFRTLHKMVSLLEQAYPSHILLRTMYWQVLGTYLYRGYQEGRRRYGLDI